MKKSVKKEKLGLDKTSLIMIILFFAIIAAAFVAIVLASNGGNDDLNRNNNSTDEYDDIDKTMDNLTDEQIRQMFPDAQPGSTYQYVDDEGNFKTITIPSDYSTQKYISVEEAVASSKYKFENYTDLTDKFLEVCSDGDVDELYHLYYPGFLEEARLNMQEVQSKEVFDSGLSADMKRITGAEEFEYGTPELAPTGTPASYAAFIYSQVNGGKQIPLDVTAIEDCVNLLVYIDNMYQTNHFMIKIGGYWYFIV